MTQDKDVFQLKKLMEVNTHSDIQSEKNESFNFYVEEADSIPPQDKDVISHFGSPNKQIILVRPTRTSDDMNILNNMKLD
jgi:hypothetical protein